MDMTMSRYIDRNNRQQAFLCSKPWYRAPSITDRPGYGILDSSFRCSCINRYMLSSKTPENGFVLLDCRWSMCMYLKLG